MNKNDLFRAFDNVDDEILERSEAAGCDCKKKSRWLKWGPIAACIGLILIVAMSGGENGVLDNYSEEQAYGFDLDGNGRTIFFPISFDDRIRYGLVSEGEVGLNKDNIYQITEDDLGDPMGTAGNCGDEALNGSKVYHYAKFPEYDSICIVDTPNGYVFYTCNSLNVAVGIGETSDILFSAYGLPDSLTRMEILAPDFQYLFDIRDDAVINSIFELLFGKSNSGLEANERRFAQLWYDTYGNDDVSYSEESQGCVYKNVADIDKAQELWTNGECLIQITIDKGYQFYIDYFPSIRTFSCCNGYYELSPEEAAYLSTLCSKQS